MNVESIDKKAVGMMDDGMSLSSRKERRNGTGRARTTERDVLNERLGIGFHAIAGFREIYGVSRAYLLLLHCIVAAEQEHLILLTLLPFYLDVRDRVRSRAT